MTFEDTLSLLSDAELERMKSRAWYRAGREWGEVRDAVARRESNVVVHMLSSSAMSEEAFLNSLLAEMSRRKEAANGATITVQG